MALSRERPGPSRRFLGGACVEGASVVRLEDQLLELLGGEPGLGEGGPVAEGEEHEVGALRKQPHDGAQRVGEEEGAVR